jgi:hypothetical protein
LVNDAVPLDPGFRSTRLMLWPDRVAGRPSGAPAMRRATPGKPVMEQAVGDAFVNTKEANWCPAAPDPRCTSMVSAPVVQAGGPAAAVALRAGVGVALAAEPVADVGAVVGPADPEVALLGALELADPVADVTTVLPVAPGGGALVQAAATIRISATADVEPATEPRPRIRNARVRRLN